MYALQPHIPAVLLAPMEGVTDAPMRALLTALGGIDLCVSEFLRISQLVPPAHIYLQHVPELSCGMATACGTPVVLQLLGGDPERMAQAALSGVALGATAIDLNFGCPARTVNRHDGGAALLRAPERLGRIVAAVRAALPKTISVSVKLRLGWDDPKDIHVTSAAAVEAGADWLTIHGRTKAQGYKPPALWLPIGEVARRVHVPVVANGDIWTLADAVRCIEETGCRHLMLGRGAVANPALPRQVAKLLGSPAAGRPGVHADAASCSGAQVPVQAWRHLVRAFIAEASKSPRAQASPRFLPGRIKQWAKMVHLRDPSLWYPIVKTLESTESIVAALDDWAAASAMGAPAAGQIGTVANVT